MKFRENHPLSSVCTFGIGGPARYYVEVNTVDAMRHTFLYCSEKGLRYFILGKGSNCLFDDGGFEGLVIANKIDFSDFSTPGMFRVGAGYSFSLLGTQTARQGWSGLEFASGIPGSVGGAVFMNAGANGHETCETLVSVDFLDEQGTVHIYAKEELSFGYRTSSFQGKPGTITGATFHLVSSKEARQKQLDIIRYRQKTQPYSDKSAGCVFRNPDCGFAGALIEQSGLKGVKVGGAQVSEKHANFIVNGDGATARDVLNLIDIIKTRVKEEQGVTLECEIRCII